MMKSLTDIQKQVLRLASRPGSDDQILLEKGLDGSNPRLRVEGHGDVLATGKVAEETISGLEAIGYIRQWTSDATTRQYILTEQGAAAGAALEGSD